MLTATIVTAQKHINTWCNYGDTGKDNPKVISSADGLSDISVLVGCLATHSQVYALIPLHL